MSLRRPNFSSVVTTSTNNQTAATSHSSRQLANYTRQCHKRISSASNTMRMEDDEEDTNSSLQHIDGAPQNTKKNDNNSTRMEQCIILLEPSLKIFQSTCMKIDKAKHKKSKKQSKSKSQHNSKQAHQQVDDENIMNNEEIDDDEVPPQIIRVARFFPQRWIPTKRALLRAPPSLGDNNDGAPPNVEVSLQYRLRLAKACVRKGLVAAAEYETLRRSIEIGIVGKKRKRDGDETKRYKTAEGGEDCSLQERVKLSLMRLPTDAVIPERSVNAWRYVREMILECCTHWEKKEDSEREELEVQDALTPTQVANWALTSWTALLISQGMDCSTASTTHPTRENSVTSIEKNLAILLTDRSTANNPTLTLASAIKCRINDLLSPEIISSLNGINLYSLGKLLASFEVADDAETHIILSVCKCSIRGVGLEQLARLLAVYTSCSDATLLKDGSNNTAVMNIKSKSTVKDLEGRLRVKLDTKELIESIPNSNSTRANSFFNAVLCATAHLIEDS